ncbi:hypothetical protein CJD36_006965 [Flavipsychrobacter stenotrophus]|uniref:Uncharacterized protein n=2 Tax=Flavipsychrobacter stenotrophus TaxID=2077091 RepID=A0A2S7SY73_9BACT|nr:hypothetical protein CJD36_006965 [Flavipsychrobacter stenotrophus]
MTQQLKQLARQGKVARIVLLGYVCFLWQHQAFRINDVLGDGHSVSYLAMRPEYIYLAILTIVLLMAIGSFFWPRILMFILSISAIAYFVVDITAIIDVVMYFETFDATFLNINVAIWLTRLVVVIFMIKGTIAAWKWQRLKKQKV